MARRRSNGAGSITQRSKHMWQGSVTTVHGKRKYVYGRTQDEVREKLKPFLRDFESGIESNDMTVSAFLKLWLAYKVDFCSPRTMSYYREQVARFVEPRLGHIKLRALNAGHGIQFTEGMKRDGKSVDARKRALVVAKIALQDAVSQMRLISLHPFSGLRVPRPKREERGHIPAVTREEVWTHADALKFLAHCKASKERLYPIFVVALLMGMRQAEILGMQWRGIDFKAGTITIDDKSVLSEFYSAEGKLTLELGPPKSKAGLRTLSVPPELLRLLKAWHDRGDAIPLRGREGYVFSTKAGNPMLKGTLHKQWVRIKREAGVPSIKFHNLRHTAATWWIAAKVAPDEVRRRLGHSQIALTMDRYVHFWPAGDKDIADKMDKLVAGWDL